MFEKEIQSFHLLRGLGNAVLDLFGTFLVIYRSEFEDSSLNTI